MANPNAYKGKSKSESSFVKGINQARKRAEARDRQKQMIEGEITFPLFAPGCSMNNLTI